MVIGVKLEIRSGSFAQQFLCQVMIQHGAVTGILGMFVRHIASGYFDTSLHFAVPTPTEWLS